MRRKRRSVRATVGVALLFSGCTLLDPLDDLRLASPEPPVEAGVEAEAGSDGEELPAPIPTTCNEDGLVARWPLDEGRLTIVHDCTSNELHGAIPGQFTAMAWGTRGDGGCIEIRGAGDILALGKPALLDLPGAFTLAGWIRSDSNPSAYLGFLWRFGSQRGWELSMSSNGELYAQVAVEGGVVESRFPPLLENRWTHIAAVFEPGERLEVYMNGESVGKTTVLKSGDALPDGGALTPTSGLIAGPLGGADARWYGAIDDLRVYSRALTESELLALALE